MSTIWLCRSCLSLSCVFDRLIRTNSFVSSMILFVLSFFVFCFFDIRMFYPFISFFTARHSLPSSLYRHFTNLSVPIVPMKYRFESIGYGLSSVILTFVLAQLPTTYAVPGWFFPSIMYWWRLWCNLLDPFHQNLLQILEICEWFLPMPVPMGSNEHYNMF